MAFKAFVVFASVFLVQSICCIPSHGGIGLGGSGLGLGAGLGGATSNGGGFAVQSASPINADGLSILSQNQIEGCLDIGGQLPFLGAIGLQGQLPTCGGAGVNYGCGSGHVGINQASTGLRGVGARH